MRSMIRNPSRRAGHVDKVVVFTRRRQTMIHAILLGLAFALGLLSPLLLG